MKMRINVFNRLFSGNKNMPDQYPIDHNDSNNNYSNLIDNELDIKPIISKKKKKSYKRFSLAEYESNNK